MKTNVNRGGAEKVSRDSSFQRVFIATMMGISVGIGLAYFAAAQIFFHNFTAMGEAFSLSANHVFFQFIREQQTYLNWVFSLTTVFMMGGMLFYGFYMSQQVTKPLQKIKQHLRAYREEGLRAPLQLNQSEFFKELARELNATLPAQGFDRKSLGEIIESKQKQEKISCDNTLGL